MKLRSGLPFLLLLALPVLAEELSVPAPTWKADPDARQEFQDIIKQKQQSGELARFWQRYRDKTIAAIKNPAPLGIRSDYTPGTELRPLRWQVPQDYRDQQGRVMVPKGTVIEPLKITPLRIGLIFIDGRDQRQVDYAITKGQTGNYRIVLTAGSPYALRVKYRNTPWHGGKTVPFYFDQRTMIISSFRMLYGIDLNRVPVVLSQRGDQLQLQWGLPS